MMGSYETNPIMRFQGNDFQRITRNPIDHPVFLSNALGIPSGKIVLQGFCVADAVRWIFDAISN